MKNILAILVLVLVSTTSLFATNEIQQRYITGKTVYAVVIDSTTLKIWDGDSFENTTTKPALAWTECDIHLTEDGFIKGLYTGDFPATITAGRYMVWTYIGPASAATDTYVGGDYYNWNGTAETSFANFAEIMKDIFLGGTQTPINTDSQGRVKIPVKYP